MDGSERLRELFREHGRPAGLTLRELAERALEADVWSEDQLEAAERDLLRELAGEAVFGDSPGARDAGRPNPPNGYALQEKLVELWERHAGEEGIPRRRWERIVDVSDLQVEEARLTWAARRCREALLGQDRSEPAIALPVEAEGSGDPVWMALEDLAGNAR